MQYHVSKLWQSLPTDLTSRLKQSIDSACDKTDSKMNKYVFFRADDVAVPGKAFIRLMDLFSQNRVPLSLAVVPTWLTGSRSQIIKEMIRKDSSLWCCHQHGWRHINHETTGKKQEFGESRFRAQIQTDLLRGKRKLESILGNEFFPVFTPPWNRCSSITLEILKELGYYGVSRDFDSKPDPPDGLPDFSINVDLHTRKEGDPSLALDNLLDEIEHGISKGLCGIMIHHQRMNDLAYVFLEIFIQELFKNKKLEIIHFKDLAH